MSNEENNVLSMPGLITRWKRELAPRDDDDQYVYIIGQLSADYEVVGPVKVGISNNPVSRVAALQTGSSARLVLVGRYAFWRRRHAMAVERVFHEACASHRLQGEWFDMEPDSAVAFMAVNIQNFVTQVLQPDETGDFFFAMGHIGLPGFNYDLDGIEFRYGK